MSDDLIKLYSARILELAADMPATAPLEDPAIRVRKRSPLCGSTVTVSLRLDTAGRISDYAQDVKACALGQASASVTGRAMIGRSLEQVTSAREDLRAMLRGEPVRPAPPFETLEVLSPAQAYRNRHASILLALDATVAAMEEALGEERLTEA